MEILSYEKIRQALSGVSFVRKVVYSPLTGSTNDIARTLARNQAPTGTLIVADEQTAGRGRLGRTWWAPPGASLLMSLLVRPTLLPLQALRLTMVAGLAAVEAIEQENALQAQLKWPNDIWLNGKKAGGILAETALTGDLLEYAIVGIGLNVNVDFSEQPELASLATSLMMETGQRADRLAVLRALVERFAAWYAQITSPQLHAAWAGRLATLGQAVCARVGDSSIDGLAEAVDADGALLVRSPDGTVHKLLAGDVTLRTKGRLTFQT